VALARRATLSVRHSFIPVRLTFALTGVQRRA